MFISYRLYNSYFDISSGKYIFTILIKDSDFEKTVRVASFKKTPPVVGACIFKCYENNKQILNFIRYMQYNLINDNWEIADQISYYSNRLPEFSKIKSDIIKYMAIT